MKNVIILLFLVISAWVGKTQTIIEGEYFIDEVGAYGQGTDFPIGTPADNISVSMDIPVANLPEGLHRLFVRFKDSNQQWSQTQHFAIFVKHPQVSTLVAGEYFFDAVGAYGSGTALNLSTNATMAEVLHSLPTTNLPEGLHRLFVRFLDSSGQWSQTLNFAVFIKHQQLVVIEAGEYFFNEVGDYGSGLLLNMDSIAAVTSVTQLITIPSNLPAGQNTLFYRFRDSNGLWSQTFFELFTPSGSSLSLTETIVDANCGVCIGSIQLSVSGGTSPYSYVWSNGGTGDHQTDLCPGEYVVTVNDAAGCILLDTFIVSSSSGVNVEVAMLEDVSCNGTCDGLIEVMASGGTPPYSYTWSNGDTAALQVGLCSGFYSVTVTDGNNCEELLSFFINEPEPLNIISSTTSPFCNGACNGMIALSTTGGTAPFSYQWNDGDTAEDRIDLCAGTYIVILTDNAGCTYQESFTLSEPPALEATVDAITNENSGQSNGSISMTTSGGVAPYTYNWSNGNTTEDVAGLTAGSYDLTITDANGCTILVGGIVVESIVSATTLVSENQLQIYPNPTKDLLHLRFDLNHNSRVTLRLIDGLGSTLLKQDYQNVFQSDITLSLQLLPKGVYWMCVQSDEFLVSERIVLLE